MVARWFSTVTISGRATVRVLPRVARAWRARLTLKLVPTIPNARPAVGSTLAAFGSAEIGRLTRLPPNGRPVSGTTGSKPLRVKFWLAGVKFETPVPGGCWGD